MSDWEAVRVADIAAPRGLVGGPFGSSLGSKDYVSSGIPVIRGVNLGSDGKFNTREFVYVTREKVEQELHRNLAQPGDVVFTQRGTLGQVGIVPCSPYDEYVISQSQMRLRVDSARAVTGFIYYQFKAPSMIAAILNHAITTGVPHVNLSILGNLKLLLPPLSVQRSISAVLSALDDKIAVNDRVARASYDLAQAHFLASVQNDARTIFLRDIIDLRYGKALTKNNREPGTVPVFGGNGISGQHSQALSSGPGIIVGRKGANAGSVSWCQGPFWVIDTGFFVDPISRNTPLEYLYFLLQEVGFRSQVGDSAIPGLNREIALACTVMLPPEEVICGVTFKVRPLLELHTHISDESASLAKLRDALLPKLMSGEIRVGDAERIVGDAT